MDAVMNVWWLAQERWPQVSKDTRLVPVNKQRVTVPVFDPEGWVIPASCLPRSGKIARFWRFLGTLLSNATVRGWGYQMFPSRRARFSQRTIELERIPDGGEVLALGYDAKLDILAAIFKELPE